ncbi:hypothetical protein F4861DRAFT_174509 [Xylaria intraflava]|nr:hypothetical protein F4861DRAFT_174509 [Xylaria intraflava]
MGTTKSCIICNKPRAFRCARCKNASYCSSLCQQGDYPIHKLLCHTFSVFSVTARPSQDHFRAILFPTNHAQPKLIWLHCKDEPETSGEPRFQVPDTMAFLGEYRSGGPIQYNEVLAKQLSNIVYITCRDGFLIDGSGPNKSIAAIAATTPGHHFRHDWRGPIIAYGRVGPDLNSPRCRDIDLNDFRHVADYFVSYGSDLASSTPLFPPGNHEKIKGVVINCLGDQKMFNKPHFEEIELPETDTIFKQYCTSDIAYRIGLPVLTKRCFPHPNWANVKDPELFGHKSPFDNQDATFLHLCCDPKAKPDLSRGTFGWGRTDLQWHNRVGSIIVVRQDGKPILPSHVEALCKYCRYDIRPYLAHSLGFYAPDEPMSKELVLSMICRPTFTVCWRKMREEKAEKGEPCSDKSPYNI